jgi:hypothetical protein
MKLYKTHQIEWNFSNQGINFTHDRIQLDHMGVNPAPTSYIPEVTIDVDNIATVPNVGCAKRHVFVYFSLEDLDGTMS